MMQLLSLKYIEFRSVTGKLLATLRKLLNNETFHNDNAYSVIRNLTTKIRYKTYIITNIKYCVF